MKSGLRMKTNEKLNSNKSWSELKAKLKQKYATPSDNGYESSEDVKYSVIKTTREIEQQWQDFKASAEIAYVEEIR